MNFLYGVLAAGLIGGLVVAGPARASATGPQAAASAAAKVDDSTLKARVTANLKKDATIAARDIDVYVSEGVVTLKGMVRSGAEKGQAARLAKIKGVTEVRNEIVVGATAAKNTTDRAIHATTKAGKETAEVTEDAAQKTGKKTKEMVGTAGTKTKAGASATGEALTDSWITTKLKTKFLDDARLKGSDIHVTTNNHVVTLKGVVTSRAAGARAAEIAGTTEGVTRVVNQLVVKGK